MDVFGALKLSILWSGAGSSENQLYIYFGHFGMIQHCSISDFKVAIRIFVDQQTAVTLNLWDAYPELELKHKSRPF